MRKVQPVHLSKADRQDMSQLVEPSTPVISSAPPSKPPVTPSVQESHKLDSLVIDTFVYWHGLVSGDWGFAATVAMIKMVIGATLVYTANRMVKKCGEAGVY